MAGRQSRQNAPRARRSSGGTLPKTPAKKQVFMLFDVDRHVSVLEALDDGGGGVGHVDRSRVVFSQPAAARRKGLALEPCAHEYVALVGQRSWFGSELAQDHRGVSRAENGMLGVLLLARRVRTPAEMDKGGQERADAGVRFDDGNRQPLMWTCVSSVVLLVAAERALEPLEVRREQVGQRRSCEEQASAARLPHQTGSLARWVPTSFG